MAGAVQLTLGVGLSLLGFGAGMVVFVFGTVKPWLFAIGIAISIVAAFFAYGFARSAKRRARSVFVLDTLPAPMGGMLRGHIDVDTDARRFRQARLIRLSLSRWVVDAENTWSVLSQEKAEARGSTLPLRPGGVAIPVEIHVPGRGEQSNEMKWNGRIVWTIDAQAEMPDFTYHASFEVPVFRTAESPGATDGNVVERYIAMAQFTPPPAPPSAAEPSIHTVPVQATSRGLEITFPPRRNLSTAMLGVGIATIFGIGLIAAMRENPVLAIVCLAPAVAFGVYLALDGLLFRSTAVVTANAVDVTQRMLATSRKIVPRNSITDVRLRMTSGLGTRTELGKTTFTPARYKLVLSTAERGEVTLGKHLEEEEGQWLAEKIRERLTRPDSSGPHART